VYGKEKSFLTVLTWAAMAGQKSLVLSQYAQRTNQGPFHLYSMSFLSIKILIKLIVKVV
jgi:hypothetical protein